MDKDPGIPSDNEANEPLDKDIGNHEQPIDLKNIVVRTFTQDNGAYNHCVLRLPTHEVGAIILPPEMLQELIKLGCRVVHAEKVDEATIALFTADLRNKTKNRSSENC